MNKQLITDWRKAIAHREAGDWHSGPQVTSAELKQLLDERELLIEALLTAVANIGQMTQAHQSAKEGLPVKYPTKAKQRRDGKIINAALRLI